jgi:cytochrome c-type biogenesis protein CcmH
MIVAFVLAAGTLATLVAVLLLVPLLRKRTDDKPASTIAAVAVLGAVLLGGAGLYAVFSNYQWSNAAPAETPASMTARLAKRVAREGDAAKLEDVLRLAHAYTVLEQFPLAIRSYQRADRIAQGRSFDALVGLGESLLAQDPEYIRGEAGKAFERALTLDPSSGKALFYGAFGALYRGDRVVARERFARILAQNPPDAVRRILEAQISGIDQADGAAQHASAADSGARISVHVTLSPALQAKVPAGAMLFVLARDPAQPGPPFAVKRLPASFPLDIELTGADAMMESRRIASGKTYQVVARVALGGTPTPTRGDPFGQVGYHVGQDGRLNIVIDRLAP